MAVGLTLGLMAISTLYQMKSAKAEGRMAQRRLEAQAAQARLQGIEQHNARMRNLDVALSTNESMRGFLNRDDRSLDAINKRLKKDAGTDAVRIASNALQEAGSLMYAGSIANARGQNKATASLYDGISSGYATYAKFKTVTPEDE